jgi:hypothetical protein
MLRSLSRSGKSDFCYLAGCSWSDRVPRVGGVDRRLAAFNREATSVQPMRFRIREMLKR